jgi:hypothetical protein
MGLQMNATKTEALIHQGRKQTKKIFNSQILESETGESAYKSIKNSGMSLLNKPSNWSAK